ncbi:MAG: rod shape-determining protein MreC [Rhodospirillales bacterium]|nr:rod shape-determining protein MreC [Rhodospirillales bacterium]
MKDNSHTISRIAAPIRGMAQRFSFMALILLAVALMMLGKVDIALMERVRANVTDAVTPILDVISKPIVSVNNMISEAKGFYSVREENLLLKQEKDRLLQWQAVARKLEAENKNLRRLLNFPVEPAAGFITARAIADTGGAFANSVVINVGNKSGVRKGQATITGEGLVGRVTDVGARSSRVLLITDLNSRIPVVLQSSQARAILAGDNTNRPKLIHLSPGASISQGDRIVTSGHGGAFPPGLPVGLVASVNEKGINIEPFVDRSRVTYLRILDYGLTGIVETPSIRVLPASSGKKSTRNFGR